jgi:hypothetical protein
MCLIISTIGGNVVVVYNNKLLELSAFDLLDAWSRSIFDRSKK